MSNKQGDLKERLIKSLFQIKNLAANFHSGDNTKLTEYGVSMAELTLMSAVRYNSLDSISNIGIVDIQAFLHTSKAAVSKMLGVLERKRYVNRDVNKRNRRELIVTLTETGALALKDLEADSNDFLLKIISRFGIEQTERFIRIVNQFSDAVRSVMENEK